MSSPLELLPVDNSSSECGPSQQDVRIEKISILGHHPSIAVSRPNDLDVR